MNFFNKKQAEVKKVIITCETLMLCDFIKYVCGTAVLPDFWPDIVSEYDMLKDNAKSTALFQLQREITILELDLILIEFIVNQIAKYYDKSLGDKLTTVFKFPYDYSEGPNLQASLQQTIEDAKSKIFEKNELVFELNEITKSEKTGKPLSEMDFLTQIKSYEHWHGMPININTTSVKDYVAIQKLYILMQPKKNGK